MDSETIQTLETALADIEANIATERATQTSLAQQAEALNAQIKENEELLTKYITIRNDLMASIEMLTEEEVDPEHPEEAEPITDADPDEINDDDYEDFEYA